MGKDVWVRVCPSHSPSLLLCLLHTLRIVQAVVSENRANDTNMYLYIRNCQSMFHYAGGDKLVDV